jgi:hypothetical protein
LIQESFPWLWKVKELIDECPSLVPAGLGNTDSEIDMSGYLPSLDGLDFELSEGGIDVEDDLFTGAGEPDVKKEDDGDVAFVAGNRKHKANHEKKTEILQYVHTWSMFLWTTLCFQNTGELLYQITTLLFLG